MIATGSRPRVPTGIGLDDVPYLTNETIFALTALPSRLIVMGGGPIGLELGQAFARLGSAVTVLHSGDRLLEKEEPEVGDLMAGILAGEGLDVRLGCETTQVAREAGGIVVHLTGPAGERARCEGTRSWSRRAGSPGSRAWASRCSASPTVPQVWPSTGACAPRPPGSSPPATSPGAISSPTWPPTRGGSPGRTRPGGGRRPTSRVVPWVSLSSIRRSRASG